jgi:ABC-2 type transport system ATP-binding protein
LRWRFRPWDGSWILLINVLGDAEAAAKLLEQHDTVEQIEIEEGQIIATLTEGTQDFSDLPTILIQAGFKLSSFKEDEINLETAFMHLTKGITA